MTDNAPSLSGPGATPRRRVEVAASVRAAVKPLPRLLGEIQLRFLEECFELMARSIDETCRVLETPPVHRAEAAAARELRAAQEVICRRFIEALARAFERLALPGGESHVQEGSSEAPRAKSIWAGLRRGRRSNSDSESWAAAIRLERTSHAAVLDAINKRLDHLLLQVDVTEKNSPMEPGVLVASFVDAGASLPREARTVLERAFESSARATLAPMYDVTLQMLMDAGVLPDTAETTTDGAQDETAPGPCATSLAPGIDPDPSRAGPSDEEPDVTQPGSERLMASDASAAGLLSQEAIFTHCAALFRRIDADGQLPKPVRTLLKQLQLPYTKYAITGRADFLVQPEHPARLLLELLVEMARALPADGGLEALPAYWNLVDVIDQIRARKAPTDKDFQDAYCLLLALR